MALPPEVEDVIQKLVGLRDHPGYLILLHRLEEEKKLALEELSKVDPFDTKEIMRLQNTCDRFEYYLVAVDELLTAAHQVDQVEDVGQEYED